jgi:hypothetical protein
VNFRFIGAFEDVSIRDDTIGFVKETAAARQFLAARVESLKRDRRRLDATNEFGEKILRLDGEGD